ncbi:hypothetical protein JKP88DRAFT_240778 [Tribonema minus]|uniref:Peptidase M48 domain-containing protein n=1 Tax=Tribonema minus TaxID=303371 RepID=A0A835ZG96_9STRA|nr:hypothetical protein JKP88DRAFT_240778 [Tribonema minus]
MASLRSRSLGPSHAQRLTIRAVKPEEQYQASQAGAAPFDVHALLCAQDELSLEQLAAMYAHCSDSEDGKSSQGEGQSLIEVWLRALQGEGAMVFVFTGLFKVAPTEGLLAAVVGHEIGHALARHHAEQNVVQWFKSFMTVVALLVGVDMASINVLDWLASMGLLSTTAQMLLTVNEQIMLPH